MSVILTNTRLNMAIHLMNNSNDIFPGDIFPMKHYYTLKTTIYQSLKSCSYFPIVSLEKYIQCSKLFRRFFPDEGMVAPSKQWIPNFGFFHDYCFRDFAMSSRHVSQFCIQLKPSMHFFAMWFCCCDTLPFDERPPLALHFRVSLKKPCILNR